MLKIKQSHDRLTFNMVIPIPGKTVFILRLGSDSSYNQYQLGTWFQPLMGQISTSWVPHSRQWYDSQYQLGTWFQTWMGQSVPVGHLISETDVTLSTSRAPDSGYWLDNQYQLGTWFQKLLGQSVPAEHLIPNKDMCCCDELRMVSDWK